MKLKKNFFLALLFLLFTVACTKIITTEIGNGLIPPIDGIFTKDTTLQISSKNSGFDTTVVRISDDNLLGYTNDAIFGKTTGEINIQLRPTFYPFTFGDTSQKVMQLDSAVLILSYRGSVGDTLQPLAFSVKRIDFDEIFLNDSLYRNSSRFGDGEDLTYNNVPKYVNVQDLADSVKPDPLFEKAAAQLRIRLSDDFGKEMLNEWDTTFNGFYKSDSAFSDAYRGFSIKPEQLGNAMLRINLVDTNTKVGIYYRVPNADGSFDTAVRYLRVNQFTSAHSNFIEREYAAPAEISTYLPPNNDTEDSLLYFQSSPGLYSTLKIKGLSGLPNMIVHRAEIVFDQVYDAGDDIAAVPNLFLAAYSTDSMRRLAVPYDAQLFNGTIGNLSSLGVNPKTKFDPISGKTISSYNFDVTRYVQSVVTRKEKEFDFVLWAPYFDYVYPFEDATFQLIISTTPLNFPGLGRVRVGGGNNKRYPMKLHIVYSVIP